MLGGIEMPALPWKRALATLIDVFFIISAVVLVAESPVVSDRGWALFVGGPLLMFSYETISSVYWCTLGQALMGTRVRDFASLGRISIHQAVLRFVYKYSVSGPFTARKWAKWPREDTRAIHDIEAGTIVVAAKAA